VTDPSKSIPLYHLLIILSPDTTWALLGGYYLTVKNRKLI